MQPLKTLMENDLTTASMITRKRVTLSKPVPPRARAVRATDADKEKLIACFEAIKQSTTGYRLPGGCPFSPAIAEASHNVVLLQTMRGFFDLLQSSVKQSRQRMYLVPPVFAWLTEQHEAVLNAILAGDAEAARKAMMAHLGFAHHH